MIVNVYHETQTGQGDPVATLSFTGRGKSVKIETLDSEVETMLKSFVENSLAMPKQGIVWVEPRMQWMEALPNAIISEPFWFRIVNDESEVQEEVSNDIEEDIEEIDEEDDIEGEDEVGSDSSDEGDDD